MLTSNRKKQPLPMLKPSTYLLVLENYLFSCLSPYLYYLLLTKWVTKVKPDINSVEVHP